MTQQQLIALGADLLDIHVLAPPRQSPTASTRTVCGLIIGTSDTTIPHRVRLKKELVTTCQRCARLCPEAAKPWPQEHATTMITSI